MPLYNPATVPPGPVMELFMIPLAVKPYRGSFRWAVYARDDDGKPGPLWGDVARVDSREGKEAAKVWPGMVFRSLDAKGPELPAFHFALDFGPSSWGRSQDAENFAKALANAVGKPVTLHLLSGWHAGTVRS